MDKWQQCPFPQVTRTENLQTWSCNGLHKVVLKTCPWYLRSTFPFKSAPKDHCSAQEQTYFYAEPQPTRYIRCTPLHITASRNIHLCCTYLSNRQVMRTVLDDNKILRTVGLRARVEWKWESPNVIWEQTQFLWTEPARTMQISLNVLGIISCE